MNDFHLPQLSLVSRQIKLAAKLSRQHTKPFVEEKVAGNFVLDYSVKEETPFKYSVLTARKSMFLSMMYSSLAFPSKVLCNKLFSILTSSSLSSVTDLTRNSNSSWLFCSILF